MAEPLARARPSVFSAPPLHNLRERTMPSPTYSASASASTPSRFPAASRRENPPVAALGSAELFRRCSAGNCDRAWQEFFERFHSRLRTAVRRALVRLGSPGDNEERVEDLVQEVYCRLLKAARRRRFGGRNEAQLMAYLQRVVTSVVVDAHRLALAEKRRGGKRVAWSDWRIAPELCVAEECGPEYRLLAGERRRSFLAICRHALGRRATPTAVRVARLALLEGWTSREIAADLDGRMGPSGIDSIVCRLRHRLAEQGIALPRRERPTENATADSGAPERERALQEVDRHGESGGEARR